MTFADLVLSPALLRALTELELAEPTPVQAAAIPAIRRGGDVCASARTGSGKTAAFLLPLLERLATPAPSPRSVRALVLAPTHELATQIGEAARRLGRWLPVPPRTSVVVGGVAINPQMMALRGGADLVVATPGRLLDLVQRNALRLGAVETLVLDEADRLLSLGFADEIAAVLTHLPARRQNLLFSATLPAAVLRLSESLLRDPTRIDIDGGQTADAASIEQRAIFVDKGHRTPLLRHLLAAHGWAHALVFVDSQYTAEHVAEKLRRQHIAAAPLHGALGSGARTQALEDFKAKRVTVLVATDLAARGLDIAQLPAVINYDLPRAAVDYLHRIGRTGRASATGTAISFVTAATVAHFRLIEKRHALSIPLEQIAGFEPVELDVPATDPHGGVKGRRKSKKDKLREVAARAAATGVSARAAKKSP